MQINYGIGVAVQRRELKQALQLVPLPKLCANLKMEMWELRDGPPLLLSTSIPRLVHVVSDSFLLLYNMFLSLGTLTDVHA